MASPIGNFPDLSFTDDKKKRASEKSGAFYYEISWGYINRNAWGAVCLR